MERIITPRWKKENKMSQLRVGLLLMKFPNLMQTYVISQIVELVKIGTGIKIIAREKPDYEELPETVQQILAQSRPTYIDSQA